MADVTKCVNFKCDNKKKCYRFTSIPSTRQSYAGFTPEKDGSCKYFMDNKAMVKNEEV